MAAEDAAAGSFVVPLSSSPCAGDFLGCAGSWDFDSSHLLPKSTCAHPGCYHSILKLCKQTKCVLVLFQHGLKRLLVASCLSWLQGVLPSPVMLEGNSPALPQCFWAGPGEKPTTTPDRCLCHQHLGTWSVMLLSGIKKNKKICHVLRSSSSSLIIES